MTKAKRGTRLVRFLFPPSQKAKERVDLAVQRAQEVEHEKRVVAAIIPAVPVIAIIYVAVNVLVQVEGNKNVALAIVTNLPLGSLAMVVFLNAASMVLLGIFLAGPHVILDQSQTPIVRKFFGLITFAAGVVYAYAFSVIFTMVFLILAYINWRLRVSREPKVVSFEEWVKDKSAPEDAHMYEIWKKAQSSLVHNDGTEASFDGPKLTSLRRELRERRRKILEAASPDFRNALYRSGAVLLSTYGLMLLASPVQFGPVEIVQFKTGPSITGYVLIASEDRGVVYDAKAKTVKSVVASDITRRLICSRTQTLFSMTLGSLDEIGQLNWTSRESCS